MEPAIIGDKRAILNTNQKYDSVFDDQHVVNVNKAMEKGKLEPSPELMEALAAPEEPKYFPPILNSIDEALRFIKLCYDMEAMGFSYSKIDSNRDALVFMKGDKAIIVRIN